MRHVVRPHDKDGGTKCLWEVAFHNGIKTHLKSKFNYYVRKKSKQFYRRLSIWQSMIILLLLDKIVPINLIKTVQLLLKIF